MAPSWSARASIAIDARRARAERATMMLSAWVATAVIRPPARPIPAAPSAASSVALPTVTGSRAGGAPLREGAVGAGAAVDRHRRRRGAGGARDDDFVGLGGAGGDQAARPPDPRRSERSVLRRVAHGDRQSGTRRLRKWPG